MNKHILMVVIATAALLAGCGGGGGNAPAAPDPTDAVPDSANASPAGLVAYLVALSALLVDDKEPVDVSGFAPAVADDSEPEALR